MENERRGDGKSQGETQRDARREKESQQARDRVRQVGQRDVERDRWKDREIKRQADRQTQREGHFWRETQVAGLIYCGSQAGFRTKVPRSPPSGVSSILLYPVDSGLLQTYTPTASRIGSQFSL